MTINGEALFEAIVMLSENDQFRSTLGYSVLSGTVAMASFGVGIPFGPFAPAIGLGLSSLAMYCLTKNKYRSVAKVLMEDLTKAEQKRLIQLLTAFAKDLDLQDAMTIFNLLNQPSQINLMLGLKKITMEFLMRKQNPKK